MKSIKEQPGERSIYIWNICGSIVNALFSVVALMIVTRFLDDREADIFSIAWTISQLMATVGTFQIRVYQATDVQGTFLFQHYLIFRIVTVAAMIVSSAAYIVVPVIQGKRRWSCLLSVCSVQWIPWRMCMRDGFSRKNVWICLEKRLLTG